MACDASHLLEKPYAHWPLIMSPNVLVARSLSDTVSVGQVPAPSRDQPGCETVVAKSLSATRGDTDGGARHGDESVRAIPTDAPGGVAVFASVRRLRDKNSIPIVVAMMACAVLVGSAACQMNFSETAMAATLRHGIPNWHQHSLSAIGRTKSSCGVLNRRWMLQQ